MSSTTFPPPGQMVDVGGYCLHLQVMGEGSPTVILDAGLASFSSNWAWVTPEAAQFTRVVAYDRAGLGWSDPAPKPSSAQQNARELHTALDKLDIQPPYVVVGHSYGGITVRAFADAYPDEVVGIVLVDAMHPEQWTNIPAAKNGKLPGRANLFSARLAKWGVLRLLKVENQFGVKDMPAQQAAEMRHFVNQPQLWTTSGNVLMLWESETYPAIKNAKSFGSKPLAVLSATKYPSYTELLARLQKDLTALSSNSVHHIFPNTTHEGIVAKRENALLVVDYIRRVVESARTGQPLTQD